MASETNVEQSLADIEAAFENSKALRLQAKTRWEAAKGRYHMELVARREAGRTLTVPDMRALEAVAIDDVDYVKDAYLNFVQADSNYRAAKVKYEHHVRLYWDGRGR